MAAKKKVIKRKVAVKAATAPKKRVAKLAARKPRQLKKGRRWLDTVLGDIHTILDGDTLTVHLNVAADIADLTISVNGRGVWKGRP